MSKLKLRERLLFAKGKIITASLEDIKEIKEERISQYKNISGDTSDYLFFSNQTIRGECFVDSFFTYKLEYTLFFHDIFFKRFEMHTIDTINTELNQDQFKQLYTFLCFQGDNLNIPVKIKIPFKIREIEKLEKKHIKTPQNISKLLYLNSMNSFKYVL